MSMDSRQRLYASCMRNDSSNERASDVPYFSFISVPSSVSCRDSKNRSPAESSASARVAAGAAAAGARKGAHVRLGAGARARCVAAGAGA
eukprot:CAMPEP_0183359270 /NCGR_PEP_ID=MMETSP0164_2-20130417/51661_1 /TAXON_ID=221442 /ORGANISM="Coccolithus pelagicus ssp braarudi, Strain PLY182g" /LENGTH=89 /DNA_ID=CAMNT_0025533337 /DNA_START=714 /DNA_END=980 /DNA_ORIENTATION=+